MIDWKEGSCSDFPFIGWTESAPALVIVPLPWTNIFRAQLIRSRTKQSGIVYSSAWIKYLFCFVRRVISILLLQAPPVIGCITHNGDANNTSFPAPEAPKCAPLLPGFWHESWSNSGRPPDLLLCISSSLHAILTPITPIQKEHASVGNPAPVWQIK